LEGSCRDLLSIAVEAGNAIASPSKDFVDKIDQIWANLIKSEKNFGEIWGKVIIFGQTQNLHPQKHPIFYGYTPLLSELTKTII